MLNRPHHSPYLGRVVVNGRISDAPETKSPNRFSVALPLSVRTANLFDLQLAHDSETGRFTEEQCEGLPVENFFEWNVPASGHLQGILKVGQRIQGCLDLVVRVGGSD